MTAVKGLSLFTPEPGKYKSIKCRVCGTECSVRRNTVGSRSFVSALEGRKSSFDKFICPHSEKSWHQKMEGIYLEKEKTSSDRLKNMLQREIEELKEKHLN